MLNTLHVLPPLADRARKTSVFVALDVPLRLSAQVAYTVLPVGSLGSAATLAAALTRSWQPVSVWRPSTLIGKLMSKSVSTRCGGLHVPPPSPEETTMN